MTDNPAKRILIMPAHNEADNIEHVIRETMAAAPPLDIVVIDDYSSDDTAQRARRMGATVISLPCNLGYGGAVQTGFRYAVEAGYPIAVLMDADGQHDPRGIDGLVAVVESGQADLALGSRFLEGSSMTLDGSGGWAWVSFEPSLRSLPAARSAIQPQGFRP